MSKKILTIQDISCYGQCSTTVALPILSALGFETAILPSAVLSTHTGGFKDFTVLDLTDEMPKIIDHWKKEGIKFDVIYTGYIGNKVQFDYILDVKENLLNEGGLFIVDPAMADHGNMYWGLGEDIVNGMRKITSVCDYVLPNITEASFLTNNEYKEVQTKEYQDKLINDLLKIGAKNVILTGVEEGKELGAAASDGKNIVKVLKKKEEKSYHGTGDIFSSIIIGNILNGYDLKTNLDKACQFIIDSIKITNPDPSHWYGVKYEEVLKNYK
ncbi:MAG: pyridoxamine kinase [Acholeplasmatales bacterium]|nr:pyridoxamine kinase [Acholeplasmatales bacterium]